MDTFKTDTEAGFIAALAIAAGGKPEVVKTEGGREFLILPEGHTSSDVTPKNAEPIHLPKAIDQRLTLQTADALGEYALRFRTEDTILVGDVTTNSIKALIDYHGPDKAALVRHVATLTLPHSLEYKIWSAIDGKLMPQLDFARFLEENSVDVKAPDGADLLEVCRDLQAKRKVNFRQAVRTASDNENFEYADETSATTSGGIELPNRFLLSFPIYFGDARQDISAFLRWRFDEGKLFLGIQLHRLEHVRQAVFQQHLLTLAERVGRPGYLGAIN